MLKARELAQYLVGTRKTLDFSKHVYVGKKDDNYLLRKKILAMVILNGIKWDFLKVLCIT